MYALQGTSRNDAWEVDLSGPFSLPVQAQPGLGSVRAVLTWQSPYSHLFPLSDPHCFFPRKTRRSQPLVMLLNQSFS